MDSVRAGFIKKILREFDIECAEISYSPEYLNRNNEWTYRIKLLIKSNPENLTKLYGKIGFEYNKEKKFLANVAVNYLKTKKNISK